MERNRLGIASVFRGRCLFIGGLEKSGRFPEESREVVRFLGVRKSKDALMAFGKRIRILVFSVSSYSVPVEITGTTVLMITECSFFGKFTITTFDRSM